MSDERRHFRLLTRQARSHLGNDPLRVADVWATRMVAKIAAESAKTDDEKAEVAALVLEIKSRAANHPVR